MQAEDDVSDFKRKLFEHMTKEADDDSNEVSRTYKK